MMSEVFCLLDGPDSDMKGIPYAVINSVVQVINSMYNSI